jgi:hypothetical protein
MVERFQFPRRNIGKYWLLQLNTRAKRKITNMVKACPMDMNVLCTREDLNIIPLGSYDYLILKDWLDQNHVVLDCGNLRKVQGIPRAVILREVIAFPLKKTYRKRCQTFAKHMGETPKDKVPNI